MSEYHGPDRRAEDRRSNVETVGAFQMMIEAKAQVEEHKKTVAEKLDEVKDELDALRVRQDAQFKELKNEIVHLQQSMTAYMQQTPDKIVERIEELIDEAFPADPEFPDATASEKRKLHRRYHAKLISTAIKTIERQQSLWDKMVAHVMQNALTLVGLALLAYFGLDK